jgi:alcohol dehydrogenase class IV
MRNQIKVAKELYNKRGSHTDNISLNVETVAFQEVLADYLKEEHMAVNPIKTNRDKVTRLLEYQ